PNAAVLVEMVVPRDPAVDGPGLTSDPQVGADDAAIPDQQGHDALCRVARHGETDPLRHRDDGGIDADHLAAGVHQPPAGVARVEGRVGLDDVLDGPATL